QTALEPLHIQYTYLDRTVSIINSTRNAFAGMTARARVYNINGKQAWDSGDVSTGIAADGVKDLLRVPTGNYSTTYFLRLTLSVNGKVVSQPTYWLSTASPAGDNPDYTALQRLPQPTLKTTDTPLSDGTTVTHTITVTNSGSAVAFFVRVALEKGTSGTEIAPILWSDNYLTLLPGETRTITATYRPADLGSAPAQLVIHGFP
ncbi:MAG: exo-beta-D-glucosaminidase, partial [Ktedonobacterales bacterium]|nr:exo-beta-D-glucosaminidase [Ktedonobacterales bacterium]